MALQRQIKTIAITISVVQNTNKLLGIINSALLFKLGLMIVHRNIILKKEEIDTIHL